MNKRERKSILRELRRTRLSLNGAVKNGLAIKEELIQAKILLKAVMVRNEYTRDRFLFVTRDRYFFYEQADPRVNFWRVARPIEYRPYDVTKSPAYVDLEPHHLRTSEDTYRLQLIRLGNRSFKVFVSVELRGDIAEMFNTGRLPLP